MSSRTAEMFPPKPRRPWRRLLTVVDGGQIEVERTGHRGAPRQMHHVRLECRCGHDDGWSWRTATELRRGVACPRCNPTDPQERPLT